MHGLLKGLKDLKKGKSGGGPLTGKTVKVQSYLVKVDNVLGEGGFATIYRCSDNTTKATFALKHFRLSGHPEAALDVQTEVAVMKALRDSPYVLNLRAASFCGPPGAEDEAFMLLDFCKDNLVSFLQARNFTLDDYSVLRIFLPVCRAVQAMHSLDPPLAHRDLKAENILLHTNEQWLLCDFGSATSIQQVYSNPREIALEEENIRRHTTPAYRAPEMWDLYAREFIGIKVDIWALGCLLYLLSFGRLPFDGDAKLQILNGCYNMPSSRPEQLRSLIRDMLVVDQTKRIGIEEVVCRLKQLAPPDLSRPLPFVPGHPASPSVSASPSQNSFSSASQGVVGPPRTPSQGAGQPVPSPPGARPTSGSFWQDQAPDSQQAPVGDEGVGWASFASPPQDTTPTAKLYPTLSPAVQTSPSPPPMRPQLYPTVGVPSPASSSRQDGEEDGQESSWASFGSPPQSDHTPMGGSANTAIAAQSSTPPSVLPALEGPLSAGIKTLSASAPFVASLFAPNHSQTRASGAMPTSRISGQIYNKPSANEAVPHGLREPSTSAAPPLNRNSHDEGGSQQHSRAPSEAGVPTHHASPFAASPLRANPLSGSLPSSPMHSRGSSRQVDNLSRSSGDSLAFNMAASTAHKTDDGLSEVEQLQIRAAQLEEHCRILEQLLEEKVKEVVLLREQNAWQGQELQQLKQQRQHQRQEDSVEQDQAVTAKPLSRSSSLGSGGKPNKLQVEMQGSAQGSSSWVAFGAIRSVEDAPTPTVIRPSASRLASQVFQAGSPTEQLTPSVASAEPVAAAAGPPEPSPATPLDELLGSKLDLSGTASAAQQAGAPMQKTPAVGLISSGSMLSGHTTSGSFTRSSAGLDVSGSGMAGSWDRQPAFVGFNPLVNEVEPSKPLRLQDLGKPTGGRSGASSVQPSPVKSLASLTVDNSGSVSNLGGSPLTSHTSGINVLQGSPTKMGKAHRRQISEPFFRDLNPLG